MRSEVSCGAIVWRMKGDNFEFLVLRRADNKIWEMPKGHIGVDEAEEDAAKRELKEELGFVDVIFESGFREVFEYESSRGVNRRFILFLAPCQKIKLSREHDRFEWISTGELSKYFEYGDVIRIYKSAEGFLKNKNLFASSL